MYSNFVTKKEIILNKKYVLLGKLIKQLRINNKYSQEEMAKLCQKKLYYKS